MILYTQSIARALAELGHSVQVLSSGESRVGLRKTSTETHNDGAVEVVRLINSPTPSHNNYDQPDLEVHNPAAQKLLREHLIRHRPDVVHVQSLIGWGGSCLETIRELGLPVVVSLHNYWFICARVELYRPEGRLCAGPEGGIACGPCCADPPVNARRLIRFLRPLTPPSMWSGVREIGRRVGVAYSVSTGNSHDRPDTFHPASAAAGAYVRRTRYLRDILNTHADHILAVSRFVKGRFVQHGIDPAKIEVDHIGTPAAEWYERARPRRVRHIDEPLQIAYLGSFARFKGLYLLVEAFLRLPKGSATLNIHGRADPYSIRHIHGMASHNIVIHGAYEPSSIPDLVKTADIVVVPSLWYDNAPQTVFEALGNRIPVVGADIGGIPDFVDSGINGLLFPAGSVDALADRLTALVQDRSLAHQLSLGIKPPRSISDHVRGLEAVYGRLSGVKNQAG